MRKTVLKRALFSTGAAICMLLFVNGLVFAKELDDIEKAIKEKKAKWKAGETSVSILPDSHRKLRARLIKPSVKDTDTFVPSEPPVTGAPVSLDWRNYNGLSYVTPIRNQGNCASCWAFATTAALESFFLKQENLPNNTEDFAEQVLISCSEAGSCGGGGIDGASTFIRDTGLPPEMDYYYTATDGSCTNSVSGWQQAAYRIGAWSYVCVTPTVDKIKNALANYGPLVTTMNIYSDFYSYTSGIYSYVSGTYQGGHAVLIIGYDDLNGCFIAKNSWGTGWGESGFFRIAYSEVALGVSFGYYTIAYSPEAACTYSISPTSQAFNDAGGSASINVTARTDCSWTAASNASWITIDRVTATQGSGTVYYSVAPNTTTDSRESTLTVAGQSVTISQAATTKTTTKKTPPGLLKKK